MYDIDKFKTTAVEAARLDAQSPTDTWPANREPIRNRLMALLKLPEVVEVTDDDKVALLDARSGAWTAYEEERSAISRVATLPDDEWRRRGWDMVRWMVREENMPPRMVHQRVDAVGFVLKRIRESEDIGRLSSPRRAAVEVLLRDEIDGRLAEIAEGRRQKPWWDLKGALDSSPDGGEGDARELRRVALVIGQHVAHLWSSGKQIMETAQADGAPLHNLRSRLADRLQHLRRKSAVRRAALAAADALDHVLQVLQRCSLARHLPDAWEKAHAALAMAYDGPALARHKLDLDAAVLEALPGWLRYEMGIDEEPAARNGDQVPSREGPEG